MACMGGIRVLCFPYYMPLYPARTCYAMYNMHVGTRHAYTMTRSNISCSIYNPSINRILDLIVNLHGMHGSAWAVPLEQITYTVSSSRIEDMNELDALSPISVEKKKSHGFAPVWLSL